MNWQEEKIHRSFLLKHNIAVRRGKVSSFRRHFFIFFLSRYLYTMTRKTDVTGIILAGGKSSRMGTEKGLVNYRGKNLIEHSIINLSPWCNNLFISANTQDYARFGVPVITDKYQDTGPMGGITTCLNASSNPKNLVLACDIPEIPTELPTQLIKNAPGYLAVIPVHPDGKAEPLCALYHRDIVSLMEQQIAKGNYTLIDFLRQVNTFFLPLEKVIKNYHPGIIRNLNKPEDLIPE